MLRPEDLRFEIYRTAAGESERLVHVPTAIERWHECRMSHLVRTKLMTEIENELREKGLTQ
jgi:hypothetical protein